MEPTDQNLLATGPWADDNLSKTSASEIGTGADANLPDPVRFVASVAKLIRTHRTVCAPDQQQPTVFLLYPSSTISATKRVPRLQTGKVQLAGRVWFLPSAAVSGHFLEMSFQDDDEIFTYITEELDLGNVPAIFYDPQQTPVAISFYAEGLSKEEKVEDFLLEQEDITLDKVFEAIDRIHKAHLITPEGQSKVGQLWANRTKGWPTELAEDMVQLYLQAGLTGAFPTCTIRIEQTQTSGRLDVEIEESNFRNPSTVIRHALLELKVLRSFGSTGIAKTAKETQDWIYKGMEQAAAYRIERGTNRSALCCFDMRSTDTGDTCFDHVTADATKLKVELKRWYLYPTSAAYRSATINTQLGRA